MSKKCGEPEDQCRKRWRNLKTSTARYLKQLRTHKRDEVKEYYLYEHIKFAIPYIKSKDDIVKNDIAKPQTVQTSTYKLQERSVKEYESSEDESYQYEIVESDSGYIVTRPDDGIVTEEGHLEETTDSHKSANEPTPAKRQKLTIDSSSRNVISSGSLTEIQEEIPIVCPDELFLKSLLPDIALMTTDQKRKFKIGVLSLVDKILCPWNTNK